MDTHQTKRFSPARRALVLLGGAALLVVSSTGGAVADRWITGDQIADGTVASRDIKDGTLRRTDLSRATVAGLRGRSGKPGPAGAPGKDSLARQVVRTADLPSADGVTLGAVYCRPDERVVSGGGYSEGSNGARAVLAVNAPLGPDGHTPHDGTPLAPGSGWMVEVRDVASAAGTVSGMVFVVCAKV